MMVARSTVACFSVAAVLVLQTQGPAYWGHSLYGEF